MKKKLFITLIVLVSLILTGCSDDSMTIVYTESREALVPPDSIVLNNEHEQCYYLNEETGFKGYVDVYKINTDEACHRCISFAGNSDGKCKMAIYDFDNKKIYYNRFYQFCTGHTESSYTYAMRTTVVSVNNEVPLDDWLMVFGQTRDNSSGNTNIAMPEHGTYYYNNLGLDIDKIRENYNNCPKYLYGATNAKFDPFSGIANVNLANVNYSLPVSWLANDDSQYSSRVPAPEKSSDYNFIGQSVSKKKFYDEIALCEDGMCSGLLDCSSKDLFGDPNYAGEKKNNVDVNGNGAIDAPSLAYWIRQIMLYIRVIGIALVIGLGVLDFARAMISSKEEQMKKAQLSFVKRIGVCIAIFFIPTLVSLVMHLADIAWKGEGYETCTLQQIVGE